MYNTAATAYAEKFEAIEGHINQQKEQNTIFHNRLLTLESTTSRTDVNVATILDKLETMMPNALRRKGDNTIMQIDSQEEPATGLSYQYLQGDSQPCMP